MMRSLRQLVCFLALCGYGATGFAAELSGAAVTSTSPRLAPLAAIQARAGLRGMRVREIRWDAVLRQNWAVLEDVEHPERPLWSELTDPTGPLLEAAPAVQRGDGRTGASPAAVAPPPKPAVLVVHYGDRVKLWRIERNVRIEMNAVAETYAAVGEEVKLRIPGSGTDGDGGWRLTGIVRGPGDVEMEP